MTALIVLRLAVILAAAFIVLAAPIAFAGTICGIASTYGRESGPTTANGERFQPWGLTAAYWYAPFNTRLRVTNTRNGRSVVVRINDRGPSKKLHRLIDLSMGSAAAIGLNGLGRVCLSH